MKKILKRISIIFPSLLLVAAAISLVAVNKNRLEKKEEINNSFEPIQTSMTISGYLGGLDVIYTDEDFNPITQITGETNIWVFFFLTTVSGIDGYEFHWDLDPSQYDDDESWISTGIKSEFEENTGITIADIDSSAEYAQATNKGKKTNFASGVTANLAYDEILFTGTTGGSSFVSGKKVVIGAANIFLKPGVTTFSAQCTNFVPGNGDDNPGKVANYNAAASAVFNLLLGEGAKSTSTVVTGTIKGASETAARALTVNAGTGAITGTVPACATNGTTATLSLEVEDKGTLGNMTGTGFSGSNGTYTVSFDNRGQVRTGTVVATAQDGTTTQTYNVSIEWEKFDDRQLSGMAITSNQTSAYGVKFTQNNGTNNGTAITIPVTISSNTTSVKFVPSVAANQGATVTVNGTSFTGTGIDVNVANGTAVNVIVTSEKGNTKTYTYNFSTIASDTDIKSISLSCNGKNLTETPTFNAATQQWEVTIPYTENNNINNLINITPTVKSGNTYTPNPVSVQFASTDLNETTKTTKVTVRDVATGETKEWTIVVKRSAADLSEGVSANSVTVSKNADGSDQLTVTYDASTKLFTINNMQEIDFDIKKLYLKVTIGSTTATLYFANESSVWNGTTAKEFSTGTVNTATDFTTTFKVKAKDATAATTYTVKGRRGAGDTDNNLSITVTGSSSGTTYSTYTPTSPQANHSYYSIKASVDPKAYLTLTPTSSKAKVEFSTDNNSWNLWTGTIVNAEYAIGSIYYVRVTSQTGAAKTYTIHLDAQDERDTTVTLDELYITYVDPITGNTITPNEDTGKAFSKNTPALYKYTVPYNAGNITIVYTPTSNKAHVYQSKNPISTNTALSSFDVSTLTGSKTLNYWVQAENETWSSAAYQLQIVRTAGSAKATLDDLTIDGTTVTGFSATNNGGSYTVVLPTGKNSVLLGFDPVQFAVATYSGTETTGPNSYSGSLALTNGKGTAEIKVKSQTGTVTNTFTVTVYSADQGHVLSELRVLDRDESNISTGANNTEVVGNPKIDLVDADGNRVYTAGINPADPSNITVNVPASVAKVFVYATTSSTNAKVTGSQTVTLNTLPTNGNPSKTYHTVTITSEYGQLNPSAANQKSEYNFVFVREGYDTENKLKTFTASTDATDTSMKINFTPTNNTITITDVDPTASTLNIDVEKESPKSTVRLPNANDNDLSTTVSIAWPNTTSGIFSFTIDVVSEAGVKRTYTVKVSREEIKLNDVCTVESITISGLVGTKTEDHSPTMTGTFPYSKDIDGNTSTLFVSAQLAAAATGATLTIEYQNPGDSTWKTYNNSINPVGVGVTQIRVTSKPEDQTKPGKEYIIKLNKVELSDDATMDKVTIGGDSYPSPKPTSDPTAKPTEVPMNPGTTSTTLKPFPHDPAATATIVPGSGITATPSPSDPDSYTIGGLKPGPNKVTIKVQPEDPTLPPEEYEVIIHVDEDTSLGDLSVTDHTFKSPFASATLNYEVAEKIAYTGEDTVEINFALPTTVDHTLVKVTVDGKVINSLTQNEDGSWGASVEVPSKTSRTIPVVISQNTATNKNTSTTYNVKIEKEVPKTDRDLLDITIAGQKIDSFSPATKAYTIVAPRNTQSITFSDIVVSDNATYKTGGDLISDYVLRTNPGVNIFTVSVYAESDTTQQTPNMYTFYIICAENDATINSIDLVDVSQNKIKDVDDKVFAFDATNTTPTFNVPSGTGSLYFRVTRSGSYAYSSVDGTARTSTANLYDLVLKTLSDGDNSAEVYVMSELKYLLENSSTALPAPALFLNGDTEVKESEHYNFTINQRTMSDDATLGDIDAYLSNNTSSQEKLNYTDGKVDYIIENVGSIGNIGVYIKPNDPDAKIIAPAGTAIKADYLGGGYYFYNWVLQGDADNNYLFKLDITVQAGDGVTTKNYSITVSRSTINAEDDNTLVDISVTHQKKPTVNQINFSAEQDEYSVTIDDVGINGIKYYVISAKNILGSKGTIYIDGTAESSHTFSIDESMWGQTITHKVYAISQNGQKGTEYLINVKIEAPSDNDDLDSLKIDGGENLIGSVNFPYSMDVKNEKAKVTLSAIAADEKASIEVILQDGTTKKGTNTINVPIDLVEGPNVMTVEVTAESGEKKRYQITINRAFPMPKLLNLGVNGEQLLDTDNKVTTFDSETLEYNVRVIYTHDTAEIFALAAHDTDQIYGTGTKPLQVGPNQFRVTVQNDSGNATEYTLNIYRYSEATMNCDVSEAYIEKVNGQEVVEIEQFRKDFLPYKYLGYNYEVSNKYDSLNVKFFPQQGEVPEFNLPAAKAEVFGADDLHPGLNNIVVVVTAPDGVTQKMYYIAVTKTGMSYEVNNKEYPDYTVEQVTDAKNTFKVNIGSDKSVDVDFTKFVENLLPSEDSTFEVTVLSNVKDNPTEILLSVSDGDTTEIIKLQVESTGNPKNSDFDWMKSLPLWIGLLLIILLLLAILICVNKDKFGKIAKKSDKKSDKKAQKEAEANGK